jgi:hypothetical protein
VLLQPLGHLSSLPCCKNRGIIEGLKSLCQGIKKEMISEDIREIGQTISK